MRAARARAVRNCSQLTLWSRVLEKLVVAHSFRIFLAFYGLHMFTFMLIIASHWRIELTPFYLVLCRSVLMLSSHLCSRLTSGRVFRPELCMSF
jgi:hypothetical protein